MVDLIPRNEVIDEDTRNTKKRYLPTDKICLDCGAIINSYYISDCLLCEGPLSEDGHSSCDHKEFLDGCISHHIRSLLDFHAADLKALSEIHGCSIGTRTKMVYQILKKLNPGLDKRVDEELIKKVLLRNRRRFWYIRNIEDAVNKAKKQKSIKLIKITEEITEITKITEIPKRKP